tara:strand:+ start:528 stop:839 length:312 start_codon:yes stop_codon:yes gene_type:complete
MIPVNYKKILNNELQGVVLTELDINNLINNDEVKPYLYLLSNIKNKIHNGYYISDVEWNFYIEKLLFLKSIIKTNNIDNKFKSLFIKNINKSLQFLNPLEYHS